VSSAPPRKRIGRWNDIATRQIVYQSDEALEVDEIDQFEIVRKRVYFDDVLLATMHSQVGIGFVITMAIFFLLLLAIAVVIQSAQEPGMAGFFFALSLPFLLGIVIRLILKQEVITIYGRRSKAAMRFTFRKTFAHEKFNEICSLVTQAQERIAAERRTMDQPTSEILMPPASEMAAANPDPADLTAPAVSSADLETGELREPPDPPLGHVSG
jgi:hypothetical protein